MPRRHMSKEDRDKVTELFKTGVSLRSIAKTMNKSPSIIQRLMKKYQLTGTTDDRPRSGRPRIMPASNTLWFECEGQERPYVCTECGKCFKTIPKLNSHIKSHSNQCNFQCDQCGRGFISSTSFTRHLRCHTGEKPYICEFCARGFADNSTMRTHIRTHTGERPHKCHLCDHACTTAGNLHAHMKVHKDKDGQVPRPVNVKQRPSKTIPVFSEKDMLRKAKESIEKYKGMCWPDGDDSLGKDLKLTPKPDKLSDAKDDDLQNDMFTYTNTVSGSDDEHCSNGEDVDSSQSRYEDTTVVKEETDVTDMMDTSEKVESVTPDGESESSSQELLISSEGNADRSQEESDEESCMPEEEIKTEPTGSDGDDIFNKNAVKSKRSRKRLSKTDREEVTELVKTGASLRSIAKTMNKSPSVIQRLMKKYQLTGTTDDRPRSGRPRLMPVSKALWFECEGQERPYICTECGKCFKTIPKLNSHIKTHSDQCNFQCDQCGRGFISSTSFTRHLRCHTGEKPYICEFCARGFADRTTMRTHIRTHTGERPHKCHLCDHACTTAGNLHAHMKVHRGQYGHVPRPLSVKQSPSKTVPIFPQTHMLLKAKRKYKKYNGEGVSDDDSSGKESNPSCEDRSTSQDKDIIDIQGDRDIFTYRSTVLGKDHHHCSNDKAMGSSQSRYEVLIKAETDKDVSQQVEQFVSSDEGRVRQEINGDESREKELETTSSVHDVSQESECCFREELLVSSGGSAARLEEESCDDKVTCLPEEEKVKNESTSSNDEFHMVEEKAAE